LPQTRLSISNPGLLPPFLAAATVFFATGAVLVLEVAGLRLLAPYVGISLQTSSAVIGLALAAIALGAWTGGRLADDVGPRRLLPSTLVLAGVVTSLTLPLVRFVGPMLQGGDALSITILAFLAVFAPCVFLAAVTPMVVKLQLRDLGRTGTIVGRLSSFGTLGGIIATFVTGFVLLAALPTSVIVVGLGLASIGAGLLLAISGGGWRRPPTAMLVLGVLATLPAAVGPSPCSVETAYHCARVLSDPARPDGRYLILDNLAHSYVDLRDPTYLQFAYVQAIASAADAVRPAGQPISSLFLGAGGLTLPRYLAATRPGSRSRVLEIDGGVLAFDRSQLLPPAAGVSVDVGDARVNLAREPAGDRDLVVGDAFGGLAVPWHLTTREVVAEIGRALRPDGIYAVNVIDFPPNRFASAELATIASVFTHVGLIATPDAIAGRGGGNFVIVASAAPLPLTAIGRRLGERNASVALASNAQTAAFGTGGLVLTDDRAPVDQLITRR
jgi:spermidine synthase